MEASSSALAAVEAAAAAENMTEVTREAEGDEEEVVVETKTTEKSPTEEVTEDSSTELDERTTKALELLEQLEDATRGPELIKLMAKHLGIITEARTEKAVEKATDTVSAKVLAALGDEYPILAEKLAKVIEDIDTARREEFRNELTTRERAAYEKEVSSRVDKFIVDNKVSEAEQGELFKLSSEFPPSPSVPPEKYLAHHLKTIRLEQAEKARNTKSAEKIKQNLSERSANKGSSVREDAISRPEKALTPLEAVQMSFDKLRSKE